MLAVTNIDSEDSALREIGIFFPQFSVKSFYDREEPLIRNGECYIDEKTFTHLCNRPSDVFKLI